MQWLAIIVLVKYSFTSPAASVAGVQATWFNTSAVDVSWDHPTLPKNVYVLEYVVHVRHGNGHLHHNQNTHRTIIVASESDHYLVTGLQSDTSYRLSVTARIRDVDESKFETSKSCDLQVFIPGVLIN